MKFSIIMPVYNAGKYLRAAIESVLGQGFRDFELIVVDDGSSDGSSEVCEEYAAKDARVVLVHQKNGGICHARNVGMEMAHGEYIGFCDHDDEYLPGYLETVALAIAKFQEVPVDIVKVNRENVRRWPDGKTELCFTGYACTEGLWNRENFVDSQLRSIISVVWNGFYRRMFLHEKRIVFDESLKTGGEDIRFNLQALDAAKTVWHCGPVRYYRHFENVATSTSCRSHSELVEAYFDSAKCEVQKFPARPSNLMPRYGFWTMWLRNFVFFVPGNEFSFRDEVKIVSRYAQLLLPPIDVVRRSHWTLRIGWYYGFAFRTMFNEVWQRSRLHQCYFRVKCLVRRMIVRCLDVLGLKAKLKRLLRREGLR